MAGITYLSCAFLLASSFSAYLLGGAIPKRRWKLLELICLIQPVIKRQLSFETESGDLHKPNAPRQGKHSWALKKTIPRQQYAEHVVPHSILMLLAYSTCYYVLALLL